MTRRWAALLSLFTVATFWGMSFTLVKNILNAIPPEWFILWRFLLAGVILIAFALHRKALPRRSLLPGLLLGILVFAGYWAQTRGLMLISPSRSALLTGLYVVMVPFCDRLLYRTKITWCGWTGSLLALAGTMALVGGIQSGLTWGDALTIACALIFAVHVVLTAAWTREHPALALAAIQVLAVAVLAAPATAFVTPTRYTTSVICVILFTAVFMTAGAFFLMMWSQAEVTATEAVVVLAFEPVAASLTSIFWDHEPVTAHLILGGALIIIAMVVSQARSATALRPIAE